MLQIQLKGTGPIPAQVMVVTEFLTPDDLWKRTPLGGRAGDGFNQLLHEVDLLRTECYVTAAWKRSPHNQTTQQIFTKVKKQAQDRRLFTILHEVYVHEDVPEMLELLYEEVARVKPRVIIALGDFAMFALTGVYGSVDTWRGSHLDYLRDPSITVIPTYTIAEINKRWEVKSFCVRDLQRVACVAKQPELYQYPAYQFIPCPNFEQVTSILQSLIHTADQRLMWLSCDVETISRELSCVGIAWSVREAMCIPFMSLDGHYWSEDQEVIIQRLLRHLLTHPNIRLIGQNFNYDAQHFAHHLGYIPFCHFDTMYAQHVLFPGIPKALDFLSSMYAHWHRYWKDELNDYSRLPSNMLQYWTYNCKDCAVTFEVAFPLMEMLSYMEREPQSIMLHKVGQCALKTMLRGILINQAQRRNVTAQLTKAVHDYEQLIQNLVGFPLNVNSPQQMKAFFYEELKLPIQRDRKTRQPTLNAKALPALIKAEPMLGPLFHLIEKKRSLSVFLNTFCKMPLDNDGRMRCSFNVAGPETFRLSSSENALGRGGNLQNIPTGDDDE